MFLLRLRWPLRLSIPRRQRVKASMSSNASALRDLFLPRSFRNWHNRSCCQPSHFPPKSRQRRRVPRQSRYHSQTPAATDTFCDTFDVLACQHTRPLAPGEPQFGLWTAFTARAPAPHHASLVLINASHVHRCQQSCLEHAKRVLGPSLSCSNLCYIKACSPRLPLPPHPTPLLS